MKHLFTKLLTLLVLQTCIHSGAWSQGSQTFSTPGTFTYTVPAGITQINFQLWGGGAGCAPDFSGFYTSGAGGGYVRSKNVAVTPGDQFVIIVGAGGSGGTLGGTPGGNSSAGYTGGVPPFLTAGGGTISQPGFGSSTNASQYVSVAYTGGAAGITIPGQNNSYLYGGGGGSAGSGGNGSNGANGNSNGDLTANGGASNGTGGSGGKGGYFANSPVIAGTNGGFPGGGAGGPGNKSGGGGQVIVNFCQTPGAIGSRHTVPYPYELAVDSVYNTLAAGANTLPYAWEQSTDSSTWAAAPGSVTTRSYGLPTSNPPSEMYYRRKATNSCATPNTTNVVRITTYTQGNGKLDGIISGQVTSLNGSPVPGITITAKKNIGLLGSPVTYTYTATTQADGRYVITQIFYGDLNNGDPGSVDFTITASRANHRLTPPIIRNLQKGPLSNQTEVNFKDSTVYAVTGVVTQNCADCLPGFLIDSLNDVKITAENTTSFAFTGGQGYGKYGVTVNNPGPFKMIPGYSNHKFAPVDTTITVVNSDINNVNFRDTSTRVISGKFRDGCNQAIGRVELTFTDTVAGRSAKFKKVVTTTASDGSYSVRLPARKYKLEVTNYFADGTNTDITINAIANFFNKTLKDTILFKYDSLFPRIINTDTINRVVNLTYHRPAVLKLTLPDTTCGPYTVMRQAIRKTFTVNIFEGAESYGCPLAPDSSKLVLLTNIQADANDDTLAFYHRTATDTLSLFPANPNIIRPFYKSFTLSYKDKYGNIAAPISKNVVVLGVKKDPGTFATVSPQIPLLILHDPPGDESYSSFATNKTTETAVRFSAAQSISQKAFVQAKIGVDLITGFGISTESRVWGQINSSLSVEGRISEGSEAIVATTTSQTYSTSGNSSIVGPEGDVYVGAALNLLYAVGHEVKYKSACFLDTGTLIVIGESGFDTKYTYTEGFIVNNEIPRLQLLAAGAPTPAFRDSMLNQVKVWQQVVKNNADNKAKAKFVENLSFNGGNSQEKYTTTSSTSSNTIEFNLNVNAEVAVELGFEIAGSGVSGGVTIGFKMEVGQATTNTTTKTTTTGYKISDSDPGDYYTVDVKTDPVYNTPCFELIAGAASCPAEPVAQKRDAAQLIIPQRLYSNMDPNQEVLVQLQIGNISESNEPRGYNLALDQNSNPDALELTIGGAPTIGLFYYDAIPYAGARTVTIGVKKKAVSKVFSYEELKFDVFDNCGSKALLASNTFSVHFVSPCSNINLAAPVGNFIINTSSNNSLPVKFDGYTVANIQYVALQHKVSGGSWVVDTVINSAFISNPTSTSLNWNTTNLPDGNYDIRFQLVCSADTIYSQRVSGIIDRKAPVLFGTQDPTDGNYVAGDVIGISYNENIDNSNLGSSQVELYRVDNNLVVPVQVSGYQNKIIVVPTTSITGFVGERMRLIVKNIADINGNIKPIADTSFFTIGVTTTNTGTKVLNLSSLKSAMLENGNDSMDIRFTLPVAAANNTTVNYSISGTATYGSDYTVSYPAGQPISTSFNGTQGKITVLSGTAQAILRIKPVKDNLREADETITISLLEGADYFLGSVISKTDTIKNDDHSAPVIIAACNGSSVLLSTSNMIDGQPVFAYLWSTGSTNPTLNVTTSGTYSLTVYTSEGFTGISTPFVVNAASFTQPALGPDITVYKNCFGETTNLTTLFNTTGFTTTWNTANTTTASPGVYRLVAASSAGCTDTAFASVILEVATWTGTISTDWTNPGNWNINKVPGTLTHVIIPGGTPNPCYINTNTAVAASLQIRSGAVVHAASSQSVMVNGKCLTLPPN